MIIIAKPGQAGQVHHLLDMHRFRARIFKERMKWNVIVDDNGLEVDQFDLPEAVYVLAIENGAVCATWRLLPTTGPTMIRDVFSSFIEGHAYPASPQIWEASRFAVDVPGNDNVRDHLASVSRVTKELFCGLIEYCLSAGITHIYTLYDMRIARLLPRLGIVPIWTSARQDIDGQTSEVGCFVISQDVLDSVRKHTNDTGAAP